MAIVHGKPGQYSKIQAGKLTKRTVFLLMLLCTLIGAAAAIFAIELATLAGVLLIILAVAPLCLMARKLDAYLDTAGRERVKFMRGAQAEALVNWILMDLDDQWHVFNGIQLETRSDIDHVVVGPGGLYCISTKSFRGLFDLDERENLMQNHQRTNLLQDTFGQAMRVRDRLAALLGNNVPFVNAVLEKPFGFIAFHGPQRNVWVVHQDGLVDLMQGGGNRLKKSDVDRCVKCLEMLQQSAAGVFDRQTHANAPRESSANAGGTV